MTDYWVPSAFAQKEGMIFKEMGSGVLANVASLTPIENNIYQALLYEANAQAVCSCENSEYSAMVFGFVSGFGKKWANHNFKYYKNNFMQIFN